MEILGELFGSEARVKIIRLFLFNSEALYTVRDVSSRTDTRGERVRTVLSKLLKTGLIRKKLASRKIKETVYFLDQKFPHIAILSDLMATVSLKIDDRLIARFKSVGKTKLIIASGIFVRRNDAQLDLLIVGDDINESRLTRIIGSLETDIGRDLTYSSLTTTDFKYRLDLHDRLIRDVIDFPYIVLVDRIGFRTQK
jgi:hypothetical protein